MTATELLALVQELSPDGHRAPNQSQVSLRIRMLAREHFGSWDELIARAGLVRKHRWNGHKMSICEADGCRRSAQAKGYCGRHYQRLRQFGQLERTRDHVYDDYLRFWKYIQVSDVIDEGCWTWRGGVISKGYGVLSLHHGRKITRRAHRFAYELLIGPIPANHQLDHECENKLCCNPAHLAPVTAREHVRRTLERRRGRASSSSKPQIGVRESSSQ